MADSETMDAETAAQMAELDALMSDLGMVPGKDKKKTVRIKKNTIPLRSKVLDGTWGGEGNECGVCKKAIEGKPVNAISLGKTYHKECFQCTVCSCQLMETDTRFFEKESLLYCAKDFHAKFSPTCAYCSEPIEDECINALGKTWHAKHLFCAQCGQSLADTGKKDDGFHEHDQKGVCNVCYCSLFAEKCGKCKKAVSGSCLSALGAQWHETCFNCATCDAEFPNGAFFEHNELPYCEKHYHKQRGTACAKCEEGITGRCVTVSSAKYHPKCFRCEFCKKPLDSLFRTNADKIYCQTCHQKLHG